MPRTVYISYRDADGHTGYQIEDAQPGSRMLKPGMFPAAFGKPALHIIHIRWQEDGQRYYLISVTDYPLTPQKRRAIKQGAVEFYVRRN